VPSFEHASLEQAPDEVREVRLYDGSVVRLRAVGEDYDPRDRIAAMAHLKAASERGEIPTGILFLDERRPDFRALLGLGDTPLVEMPDEALRPSPSALEAVNRSLMG